MSACHLVTLRSRKSEVCDPIERRFTQAILDGLSPEDVDDVFDDDNDDAGNGGDDDENHADD